MLAADAAIADLALEAMHGLAVSETKRHIAAAQLGALELDRKSTRLNSSH